MSYPIYCIVGSRAVKATRGPDGSVDVQVYVADEDEFRRATWFINELVNPGPDTELVSKDEFEAYVARQRAETAADPAAREQRRIQTLQAGRMLLIETVRKLDPQRASALKLRYGASVLGAGTLDEERKLTEDLIQAVVDIDDPELLDRVLSVRTLCAL
jgi:hypothetical protein